MSEARTRHFRGLALMAASAASFAANALLIRGLGHLFNVWLLAGVRFAVGLAVLGLVFRRQFQPRHLLTNRKLIERGVVGGIGVWTYYEAIVHIGAGRSTFINGTYIFWAAFMAAWVFRERLRPVTVGGATAALAGIALLTDVFARGAGPNPYDGFALLSALGSAYVAIAIRQLHATEHTSTIFGAQCAYGLAFCLLCGTVSASLAPAGTLHIPAAGWSLALVSGVCVAAGQLAQTRAYRDLPVAEGSLVQMLSPLGTAVGGAFFYGEHLTPAEMLGAALILGGSACAAVRRPA